MQVYTGVAAESKSSVIKIQRIIARESCVTPTLFTAGFFYRIKAKLDPLGNNDVAAVILLLSYALLIRQTATLSLRSHETLRFKSSYRHE